MGPPVRGAFGKAAGQQAEVMPNAVIEDLPNIAPPAVACLTLRDLPHVK